MSKSLGGLVQIYTGNGKGKTTAAIGQGIRACGAGLKVLLFSFMKNRSSEHNALQRLEPDFSFHIVNRKTRGFYERLTPDEQAELKQDVRLAWELIAGIIDDSACDLLILDEIMAVLNYGLISTPEMLELIDKSKARHIDLILTGRNAPQEIIESAELITEMKEIKHPYKSGVKARRGIEY